MFGWGAGKQRQAIRETFPTLADAFIATMDEIRDHHSIKPNAWNRWETFAFVCWTYHIAIMNLGKSLSAMRKMQAALNDIANAYLFQQICKEHAGLPVEERKRLHERVMNSVQQRSLEYNDAFNRDKARSFDQSIPDSEIGSNLISQLLATLVVDARLRRRVENSSPAIGAVFMQHYGQLNFILRS